MLRLLASLESGQRASARRAIMAGAKERSLQLAKTENFSSVTGKGVTGTVDGHTIAVGNAKLS